MLTLLKDFSKSILQCSKWRTLLAAISFLSHSGRNLTAKHSEGRGREGLPEHRVDIFTKACEGRMMVLDVCAPLLPLNSNAEMLAPPCVMGWEAGPLTDDQISLHKCN